MKWGKIKGQRVGYLTAKRNIRQWLFNVITLGAVLRLVRIYYLKTLRCSQAILQNDASLMLHIVIFGCLCATYLFVCVCDCVCMNGLAYRD